MLRKPHLLYLLTGRKGLIYPYTSPEDVLREIERNRVQYIVEEPSTPAEKYLRPALSRLASQGRITLAYETSGRVPNRVWRIERERGMAGVGQRFASPAPGEETGHVSSRDRAETTQ
jgi:hypothetical protein